MKILHVAAGAGHLDLDVVQNVSLEFLGDLVLQPAGLQGHLGLFKRKVDSGVLDLGRKLPWRVELYLLPCQRLQTRLHHDLAVLLRDLGERHPLQAEDHVREGQILAGPGGTASRARLRLADEDRERQRHVEVDGLVLRRGGVEACVGTAQLQVDLHLVVTRLQRDRDELVVSDGPLLLNPVSVVHLGQELVDDLLAKLEDAVVAKRVEAHSFLSVPCPGLSQGRKASAPGDPADALDAV